MKPILSGVLASLFVLLSGCDPEPDTQGQVSQPNILLIVIDDVGFGDLGLFGSEIRTPTIDDIARQGTLFTDFHTGMTCSPTRAMLLSGVDHHLAGLGNMASVMAENQKGQPGYEGYLNDQVVSIANLLKDGGYRTYMVGKWHLGYKDGYRPQQKGFDRSFALLGAGASHFADMRGLVERRPQVSYMEDDQAVESLPEDFHTSSHFTDKIIEYIHDDRDGSKPFFAYLAYTAPHWPLGVPDEYLDLYAGMYDEGYDVWRKRRIEQLSLAGTVPANLPDAQRLDGVPAWNDLLPEEQKMEARKMELYAAMMEHLDIQLARLMQSLEDAGELENTAIILMSDNGPEGNDRSRIASNREWLPRAWDLSYENMGRKDSYVFYGPGWGQVSSAPYQLFKAYPAEGGIRAPLIVKAPGNTRRDEVSSVFTTVVDIAPTVLQLAHLDPPNGEYQGKRVHPLQGDSLLPYLRGQTDAVHGDEFAFGWELFGHRAVRKGDWKLLWVSDKKGHGEWTLHNLLTDPMETNDVSAEEPEKLQEMLKEWSLYMQRNRVILPDGGQGNSFGF